MSDDFREGARGGSKENAGTHNAMHGAQAAERRAIALERWCREVVAELLVVDWESPTWKTRRIRLGRRRLAEAIDLVNARGKLEGPEDHPAGYVYKPPRGRMASPLAALIASSKPTPAELERQATNLLARSERLLEQASRRELPAARPIALKAPAPRAVPKPKPSQCACGHDDHEGPCTVGLGTIFGRCPCERFHGRRSSGQRAIEARAAKRDPTNCIPLARELLDATTKAVAALAALGEGSWLPYEIALKAGGELAATVAGLEGGAAAGLCRRVLSGRFVRWTITEEGEKHGK